MKTIRSILGGTGLAAILYGLWSARAFDPQQLISAVMWLGGGVVAHDAVLAPAVVVSGAIGARWLPHAYQAPVAVGAVLWGSVTLAVIPVLGRFGARSDNPTLLDRPYLTTWMVLSAVAALAVLGAGAYRSRRAHRVHAHGD